MVYVIESGFAESGINPITNRPYDSSWMVFCLTDSSEYHMLCGSQCGCAYTLKVSRRYPYWESAVCDFIEFQETKGKNIILFIGREELQAAKEKCKGHHFNEACLRDYEPDVLVHSTSGENWQSIQADGCLKSWNILAKEKRHWEDAPIGLRLGDPKDFSDYVMFSTGAISSEIVVLSKQNGKIVMDENMPYTPGARLYFDAAKIAADGLLIRDGQHLKVERSLPLQPYLIWTATWEIVGLKKNISTPKEFTAKSNQLFQKLYGTNLQK